MADLTRPTTVLGWPTTERTVSQIHPANQDILAISGKLAGEDLGGGQLVYLKAADDAFWLTDANSGTAALKNNIGVVAKDAYAGDPVTVVFLGELGGWGITTPLTPGAFYYASDTPGAIGTTPSATTYMPVGVATGADTILFFPFLGKLFADVLVLALAAAVAADA